MKTQEKISFSSWINQLDIWILGAIAIISIVVALLDFLGALDSIPWLKDRVPVLILLSVGLIASYIILERRNQLKTIHKDLLDKTENLSKIQQDSTEFIIHSLRGVEVRSFDNDADCFRYMNERVAQASKYVDDISWSPEVKITPGLDRQDYLDEEYRKIIAQLAQIIPFREILIFHDKPGRIKKLRNRIWDNWPGYSCVYFEDTEIPLLQFMIIDREEVIVLSEPRNGQNLAIRHPDVVRTFVDYYEALWQKGRKLKYGTNIYWDEVEKVLGQPIDELRDKVALTSHQ